MKSIWNVIGRSFWVWHWVLKNVKIVLMWIHVLIYWKNSILCTTYSLHPPIWFKIHPIGTTSLSFTVYDPTEFDHSRFERLQDKLKCNLLQIIGNKLWHSSFQYGGIELVKEHADYLTVLRSALFKTDVSAWVQILFKSAFNEQFGRFVRLASYHRLMYWAFFLCASHSFSINVLVRSSFCSNSCYWICT